MLQAFKDQEGFSVLNGILEESTAEVRLKGPCDKKQLDSTSPELLAALKTSAEILSLYSKLVTAKNVTEAQQTAAMVGRDRDRTRVDQFSTPQFLVELRMAIFPAVRRFWDSDLMEKATPEICNKLIEVLRIISGADSESNALKRSDKVAPSIKAPPKTFKISSEQVSSMVTPSINNELAVEALYRCNNNAISAQEYCREITQGGAQRNPVPEGDIAPTPAPSETSRPPTGASTESATPDDQAMADSRANIPTIVDSFNQTFTSVGEDQPPQPQNFEALLSQFAQDTAAAESSRPSSSSTPAPKPTTTTLEESKAKQVTVDDLNDERKEFREAMIDKCLDVINAHSEVTFEVADLIKTVTIKSDDPQAYRTNVVNTLVVALMSFAGDDDPREAGEKIGAYANLLALLLRDKLFYADALGELTDNLSTLLSFIRVSPDHKDGDISPWIPQILLVVEMLLCEDARPRKTTWSTPTTDIEASKEPVLETIVPSVPEDDRSELFDKILEILPKVYKDEMLALAILRILVILTRSRPVAQAISEKKNMQRLFLMAKQLAGSNSTKIQSPLMLILRHCVEDDETIKQIMRSDIRNYFETGRQQRSIDTSAYLRALSSTALRQPELFVEVTNEMVKFNRWQYTSPGDAPNRHMSLVLKETVSSDATNRTPDDSVSPTVQATEDLTIQDLKPSMEGDSEMPDVIKVAAPEKKLPVVANPDGVIHFLLVELWSYKEIPDVSLPTAANKLLSSASTSNEDTPMDGAPSAPEVSSQDSKDPQQPAKPEFKPAEHPIYIYRCFILQCLTELLSSYNATKIEFISWHKSKPIQAMTPSKPRSAAVGYLLNDLLPVGTLDHPETIELRKKLITSGWADSVICALVSKTGEQPVDTKRQPYDNDDEADLLHVRKYVLDNIFKAFGSASASTDPLDVKYAHMLALSDLMSHIMSGKENTPTSEQALASVSQKQLRRIMYEKGFMTVLTQSIAEIDLNFPGARRAVKYILRPLKTLSHTAVQMSEYGLITTTPGHNDVEEIESASSASEMEDDREETPDLFRNSTLGMFEPGREEDSSSESEDGML